jgi:predicted nucleotidyltransferase
MISLDFIKDVAERIGRAANAERVILFGSYARGQPTENSDVDFLVVADSDLPPFKRSRGLYGLIKPHPFAMDILVYTPAEIEKESKCWLSFTSTILREGKVLYARRN